MDLPKLWKDGLLPFSGQGNKRNNLHTLQRTGIGRSACRTGRSSGGACIMYIPVTTCDDVPVYVDAKFEFSIKDGQIKDIIDYQVDDFLLEDELVDIVKEVVCDLLINDSDELKGILKEWFGIYPACCPRVVRQIGCAIGVMA